MKQIYGLVFCYLINTILLQGQHLKLESLTIDDGLSQGMIFNILQSRDGFLWVATKDGINRYDGLGFKVFSHKSTEPFTLSGHVATVLFEDSRGWLWIGTLNNGLNLFDKKTERFYHLSSNYADASTLQSNNINAIEEDASGNIWVATEAGIDKVVIPSGFAPNLLDSDELNKVLPVLREVENFKNISFIKFQEKDVFIGTSEGLYKRAAFRQETPKETFELKGVNMRDIDLSGGVFNMIEDKYGATWLSSLNSLIRLDKGKIQTFSFPIKKHLPRLHIALDSNGDLLIGFSKLVRLKIGAQGIVVTEEIEVFDHFICTDLHIDHSGIVWIGSNGFGIKKYNPRVSDFHHSLAGTSIQHVFEDQEERVWVWGDFKLLCLDRQRGTWSIPEDFPEDLTRARQVFQDKKGCYWFHFSFRETGTKIVCYDPKTKIRKTYPYTSQADPLAPFLEDHQGNIWLGCMNGFAIKLDSRSERFVYYDFRHLFLQNDSKIRVVCMYQDDGGIFWLGTPLGLVSLKESPGQTPEFRLIQSSPGGLSENYIQAICPDPEIPGVLWIGTKGGGLNRFDSKTGTFTYVSIKDGLPNNVVYGILPESGGTGNLWLSTNRGLSCYNPQKRSFKNYLAADGLQDNEFNTAAYYKLKSGELVFGGINGVNVFRPDQIRGNTISPRVVISNLMVNNQPVDLSNSGILSQVIEYTKAIKLRYDENMLSFNFSVLDFAAPQKNAYEYQMKGLEKDWVKAGSRHEVVYTNLPPGAYTFRVRGANSSGVWSEKPAEIAVVILPPWWRTNWAWGIWFGLSATLIYLLYRFQVNRIRLNNQLLFEQKEAERLADLDRMKTDFFSNITHEFRTPLTLILEPLRQALPHLKDPVVYEKVDVAEKNSRQLLTLINQLLDLAKVEQGAMKLELHQGDFSEVVRRVVKGFSPLAEKKNIGLELRIKDGIPIFEFDKNKIELVFNNLISNALKFTQEGGRIDIEAGPFDSFLDTGSSTDLHFRIPSTLPSADRQPYLLIKITDTGVGISRTALPRIFDRYYQAETSDARKVPGTGIGLALTKEMVTLMGGAIQVSSEPGTGTTFSVLLPMTGQSGSTTSSEMEVVLNTSQTGFETQASNAGNNGEAIAEKGESLILVIEDNEDLRRFIQQSISSKYRVIVAGDGDEGIQKALQQIPDLVVTDLMMPEKDGYQVCEELKNNELTSHIPIILLTAKSAMDSKLQGLRTGADDYLTKPFNTEELMLRMANLIENRRLLREKYSHSGIQGKTGSDQMAATSFSKPDQAFLLKITHLLEDQLEDENLTVEGIARQLYISRVQLHRKLKALTDQPANEFIRNYRLDRALEMLKNKEGNVSEIAVRTGFGSQKYFSVRFKERFGLSPSEVA